jgi:hypothetical protein
MYSVFQNSEESSWNSFLLDYASREQIYHFIHLALRNTSENVIDYFTGVKLMTVTVITVIPIWRMWNQVRIFFVD